MNYRIQEYINLARSGTIAVCKEQLQLCDYVEKAFRTESLWVDEEQLEKYLALQKYFPFQLFEWEVFCFTLHNCVYRPDGCLRWPDLLILVGRGAGKNGYLSFEDFCLMTEINGVKQYHIDICANAEEQAKTSFNDIYSVLEDEKNKKKLSRHFTWNKEQITNKKTGSVLRFRTSNAKTKDGGRPGKIDFDEYHQYENYKYINVFKTGLGKKRHPRTTITTTNGHVRGGPLDQLIARAEQILKGGIGDNGLLPFLCRLDDEKEVHNPALWSKANPSLHRLPELKEQMRREYEEYKADPISNCDFMTKRMNLPQGDQEAAVTAWENLLAASSPLPDLEGKTCVAGIDYAKTQDFVAAGLLFRAEGKYCWISHTWVCARSADLPRIKAPLQEWEKQGLLTFVDDVEVPPEAPAQWLREQAKRYNITGLAMDTYRWTLLKRALNQAGFDTDKGGENNVTLIRKSNQMLLAPALLSVFSKHEILWGDSPLMCWYTNNACIQVRPDGNMTFEKVEPKSRKTDGFMALVAAMAIGDQLEEDSLVDDLDMGVFTY